ncbi:S9 family peptidase [Paenibacillus polymyxa]|uniref:S9 family peptidase n=1 Tax=Paenibacillus polymyxa TaxID=1406 RepID=UPI0008B3B308|nr:S9 family peptidase [Paenibacillus polymyxa]SEK05536.1 Dipeptidyl aminopeptidase/acylaminoacyl peptidase [Paenibacillus polymyxa]
MSNSQSGTTKRRITADDLYRFHWVSDPAVHPTSGEIAYVEQYINKERTDYNSAIWLLPFEGKAPIPFTYGPKDETPVWSPDGSQLAFLRSADGKRQVWIIPARGGEARQLTHVGNNVRSLAWSPDGAYISFVAKTAENQSSPTCDAGKQETQLEGRVVNRTKAKFDGYGLWDDTRDHLYVTDVTSGHTVQLTSGAYDVAEPVWSPNGQQILFVARIAEHSKEDTDLRKQNDLFTVAPATSNSNAAVPFKLTHSELQIESAAFSPDGTLIAFYGHDRHAKGATQTRLYTVPSSGGTAVCVSETLDAHLGNAGMSDMRSHLHVGPPRFSADSQSLYTLVTIEGNVHVYQFALDGTFKILTQGEQEIYQFELTSDEQHIIAASTNVALPGDLFRIAIHSGTEERLTRVNDALLDEIEISVPESFWTEVEDGRRVQGWVMKPAGFKEGEAYPAILEIHGGPHAMYSNSFFHEFQLLAAQGYAVIYTNPGGSRGYGQSFTNVVLGDYGGRDYTDLLSAVDEAIRQFPFIDPERLGVTGGSYGGFMTNWIVGHTDRFRAAVTQRSISNWLSMYGVSDIGYSFTEDEVGGNPWDDFELLWRQSPLAYVQQINTPLLILHGEQDLRCPIEQGEQLFTALRRLGKPTQFVRFPASSHELSRKGHPQLRVERLQRITDWFVQHKI